MLGRGIACFLILSAVASTASAQNRPCRDGDCASGQCFEEREKAFCVCEAGLMAEGLACVPETNAGDPLRLRRAPGVTDDVLMLAQQEIGRAAYGVGRRRAEYPNALFDYVDHGDWWCSDFVSWVYRAAGVPFSGGYEEGGWMIRGNEAIQHWFEERGLWIDKESAAYAGFTPQPGDFVRFRTRRGGHSGIVERLDGDTLILIEGNFDNRVNRSRFTHYKSESSIAGFGVLSLHNDPPVVSAGEDQEVFVEDGAVLEGQAQDDGPVELFDVTWSRISGPAAVTFESAFSPSTSVEFHEAGTYTLRLRAFDGVTEVTDEITIAVVEPPPPALPTIEPIEAEASHCSASSGGSPGWLLVGMMIAIGMRRRR